MCNFIVKNGHKYLFSLKNSYFSKFYCTFYLLLKTVYFHKINNTFKHFYPFSFGISKNYSIDNLKY